MNFVNRKDEFTFESSPLGKLHRINIGHDNSSRSPGWFLDKVTVEDLDEKRVYEFPCNRWLAKDQDDGKISRDLTCGQGSSGESARRKSIVIFSCDMNKTYVPIIFK